MSKLLSNEAIRSTHARLTEEGRLGAGIVMEIGYQIAEIKKRRRALEHPEVTATLPKPPKNKPPHWAEVALTTSELEAEAADFSNEENLRLRVSQGLEMLLENRDRQALAKASLQASGRPLAGKREVPEVPGRPTDEFIARAGGEQAFDISVAGKGERAPVKQYVRKNPWQAFRNVVQADVSEAFDSFADDAEIAGVIRVTANYDGIGGAARGPRTGGLGDVEQNRRQAFKRHEYRMARLSDILDTPQSRVRATTILAWLILRERLPEGKVLSMADLGQRLCPDHSDAVYHRGAAREAIEMVGRALVNINHELEAEGLRIKGGAGIMSREVLKQIGAGQFKPRKR